MEDDDAVRSRSSAGHRSGCRYSGSFQPCRALRNGVIMSDLTGPGRNSEMSMMRSSNVSGPNLPMSSRWPGLSIWKQPRVWVVRISRKVGSSSSGTWDWSSRSIRRRRRPARTSSTAWAIADCIRMPRMSSLSRPSASTSSLSNWLIGKPSQLASTGVRSSRLRVGQDDPARVQGDVPGQAVEALDEVEHQVEAWARRDRWPAARAARRWRCARHGRGCAGTPWRSRRSRPGAGPSAAPTSRMAWRTR